MKVWGGCGMWREGPGGIERGEWRVFKTNCIHVIVIKICHFETFRKLPHTSKGNGMKTSTMFHTIYGFLSWRCMASPSPSTQKLHMQHRLHATHKAIQKPFLCLSLNPTDYNPTSSSCCFLSTLLFPTQIRYTVNGYMKSANTSQVTMKIPFVVWVSRQLFFLLWYMVHFIYLLQVFCNILEAEESMVIIRLPSCYSSLLTQLPPYKVTSHPHIHSYAS